MDSTIQYTKHCERHFEKDQFVVNPDLAVSIGFQTKAKILIQGAVPSKYLWYKYKHIYIITNHDGHYNNLYNFTDTTD